MEFDLEALHRAFLAETADGLATMEESLVALESHPGDAETLATVFRIVHNLKGNASSLGFTGLAELAHVLEDLLEQLRDGRRTIGPEAVSLLLAAVDTLREMLPEALAGTEEMSSGQRALFDRLCEAAAAGAGRGTAAASPGRRPEAGRETGTAGVASLRVDRAELDRMLDLMGEITIARGRLGGLVRELAGKAAAPLLEAGWEVDRLFTELQELVMKVRMVPIGPMVRQYQRTVRDLAAIAGKLVRLDTVGEEVEVDTTVIEHLRAPLTHLIRNAVDHGIEPPAVRQARGKDPCGHLLLGARREAGSLVVELADDGAGFDRAAIFQRAVELGLAAESDKIAERDLDLLALEAGFSTAAEVTEISGRGVGLDVVRRNLEALRGSLEIDSRPGEGTRIALRLPLTLAIIEGFEVGVGEETYILPLDSVLECLELPAEDRPRGRGRADGSGVLNLRGEPLPYLRLRHLFGIAETPGRRENVVVLRHAGGTAGIAVDTLNGERQTVIKPLGPLFQGVPGIAGSTILGTGRVALILDVPGLMREALGRQARATGQDA